MFKVIISETIYNQIVSVEGKKEKKVRSYLYKLMHQQPIVKLSAAETDHLKSHPEEVLKNPSSLYVLDVTHSEALRIQNAYGVLCLSSDSLQISPLIDINDIHVPEPKKKKGRGWDSVLDSVENLPSNALLISDRYLFSFRSSDAGDGLINIRNILNELLPHQFEGNDYHVTVIFDKDKIHDSYSFDEIVIKLYNITQQLGRTYPIMLEVLGITEECSIYLNLHSRRIISNYYFVEASHKLAAFNKENEGTVQQTLIPFALFTEGSLNGISASPLESINQTLTAIKEFHKTISSNKSHNDYVYAVNGKRMEKCMGIRNRLIK